MNLKKEKRKIDSDSLDMFSYFIIGILIVLSIVSFILLGIWISESNAETEPDANEEEIVSTYCDMVLIADERFSGNGAVYYDKNTKVMYYVLRAGESRNGITPIYNADGSLKLYDDDNNE